MGYVYSTEWVVIMWHKCDRLSSRASQSYRNVRLLTLAEHLDYISCNDVHLQSILAVNHRKLWDDRHSRHHYKIDSIYMYAFPLLGRRKVSLWHFVF